MHSLIETRRSRTSLIIFLILAVFGSYFTLHALLSPQQPLLPFFSNPFWATGSASSKTTYHNYTSAFSFNLDLAINPSWMARIPNTTSLSSLSIPGTHDTFTNNLIHNVGFQCQNHDLVTQLHAGLRYFDVRGRLVYDPADSERENPPVIAIYHGHVATGYDFQYVLETVFDFLEEHPTEGVILRVKEEGAPLPVGRSSPAADAQADEDDEWVSEKYNTTFEEAFNYYRHTNPLTAPGCAQHLLTPWPPSPKGESSESSSRMVPTLGELRGRALVLYEFATTADPGYGISWTSPHIALEDMWVILAPELLEQKWAAVRANLEAAAGAREGEDVLFLSHLSASVGVTPIEAAAGPLLDRTNGSVILGLNERTGRWLEKGRGGKTGVVMADFPGRRLVGEILKRNEWLLDKDEEGGTA